MARSSIVLIAVLVLIIGAVGGYWYGSKAGYSQAEADIKKLKQEDAKASAEQAAKAANPFRVSNPLEGINTNPFEKTKKVLNPFK